MMTAPQVGPDIQSIPAVGNRSRRAPGGNGEGNPDRLLPDERLGSERRRLVVLVPKNGIDDGALIKELLAIAVAPFVEILFVGLSQDGPGSRTDHHLDRLISKAQGIPVAKRRQVVEASSWLKAVQIVAHPGDLIVCHPRQGAGKLAKELAETTPFPVYLLSSARPALPGRLAHGLGRLAFELFPLAVGAAFFWLQVQIDAQTTGLVKTAVIFLTVLVELGLIFLWSLFIRR